MDPAEGKEAKRRREDGDAAVVVSKTSNSHGSESKTKVKSEVSNAKSSLRSGELGQNVERDADKVHAFYDRHHSVPLAPVLSYTSVILSNNVIMTNDEPEVKVTYISGHKMLVKHSLSGLSV